MAVASVGLCANLHLDPDKTMPPSHHSVFLLARCPSCYPSNSIKALKALIQHTLGCFSTVSWSLIYEVMGRRMCAVFTSPLAGCRALWCVCLSVFVSPLVFLKNHTAELHQIFCACWLWPWLSSHLAVLQYVTYFWFCGWSCFHIMGHMAHLYIPTWQEDNITAKTTASIPTIFCCMRKTAIVVCAPGINSVIYDCFVLKSWLFLDSWCHNIAKGLAVVAMKDRYV